MANPDLTAEQVRQLRNPRHRTLDKVSKKRSDDSEQRQAYAEVDERDGKRCRCCNRRGNPNAITTIGRIHRCHIHDAGTLGEMSAKNLVSLCWICAALETGKQLFFVGKNANKPMRFEVMDAAVEEIFGHRTLPAHVRIVKFAPRQRYGS